MNPLGTMILICHCIQHIFICCDATRGNEEENRPRNEWTLFAKRDCTIDGPRHVFP